MEYDIPDGEAVSTAVVRAVCDVNRSDPCSIPLLTKVIDPDALDDLFAPTFTGKQRTGGQLSFVYNDCRVTIDNNEYLTVTPLETSTQTGSHRSDADADGC